MLAFKPIVFFERIVPTKQNCILAFLTLVHVTLFAQQAPDAGQSLQQFQSTIELTPPTSQDIPTPTPSKPYTPPGGVEVKITQIKLTGNTEIPEETILENLGDYVGKLYDLAGLRDLAYQVTTYYNRQGYPFIQASLPEQDLTLGILHIEIVEGRYGSITVTSDNPKLQEQGSQWLSSLQEGSVIRKNELERTLLMLDDQAGIKTFNTIKASEQPGAGDLTVNIVEEAPFKASVDIDNHGNRFTGYYRAQTNLSLYNRINLGDELALQGVHTSESLSLGSVSYSSPLGTTGLKGKASYAVTRYQLGKEFASSQSSGVATELGLEVSQPLIRNRLSSLTLRVGFLKKHLLDENINGAIGKSSTSVPVSLQFYELGGLGGGLTFASLGWTHGELRTPEASDTLNTMGSFNKYNLNLIRFQSLGANYTLYVNFSKQLASRNLDSSEGYSLGGVSGVRAYPSGEANGDEFWLSQVELRYATGSYTPFVFYDYGKSRANAVGSGPTRSISGLGAGVRYLHNSWSAEAMLAWRINGGPPQADTSYTPTPRIWLKIAHHFY